MVEVGGPQSSGLRFWWTSALLLTDFTVLKVPNVLNGELVKGTRVPDEFFQFDRVDISPEMVDLVYLLLGERFFLCFVSLKIDPPCLVWLEDKAHHIVSGVIFNGVVNDCSCILP